MVDLIISRSSLGIDIKDKLTDNEIGINHGEITNNAITLEEVFYIRHNGTSHIDNLKLYLSNLSELLTWADTTTGDGLLLDSDNDDVFETNFLTGVGDSLANAITLGTINATEEKIIK